MLSTTDGIIVVATRADGGRVPQPMEPSMVERHRYRGHDIRIELVEVMPRLFRWMWTIDGTHTSKGRVLLAEVVARSEAFLYAQVMVARLKSAAAA